MTYENEINKLLINEIKNSAQEFINNGVVSPINLTDYYSSLKGERATFEKNYFTRRKELNVLAISLLLDLNNKEKTLELLEQTIWEVCNEFAWGLPAHFTSSNGEMYKESNKTLIDLFASETGQALAEIITIVGKYLSPFIKNRVYEEIDKRIFQSFLNNDWGWEHRHDNWSAVIGGSIGMTALDILEKGSEKQLKILNKLHTAFDSYMNGYANDGACFEGVGYWVYGFGYYIYFAEKYNSILNDDKFLKHAKVKNISEFPYNSLIFNNSFVPYSDSSNPSMPTGLLNFCSDYFKIEVPSYSESSKLNLSHCYRWAHMYRNVIWTKESKQMNCKNNHYFNDVQWLIIRNEKTKFSFSAEAGENNSHHNHNDVGNFIIGNENELFLTDLGSGSYDKNYFLPNKRYESLNTRSLGHSVALINNEEQINVEKSEYYHIHGDEFKDFFTQYNPNAKHQAENVTYNKDNEKYSFSMNLESAYPTEAMIKEYVRTFEVDENQRTVNLIEKIKFKQKEKSLVSQGFVSFIKPHMKSSYIEWISNGTKLILKYDAFIDVATCEKMTTNNHLGNKICVYITRLKNKDQAIFYERNYEFSLL